MILGDFIKDENGINHKMSGILPFRSKKSKLSVGYRYIEGLKDTTIIKQNQLLEDMNFIIGKLKIIYLNLISEKLSIRRNFLPHGKLNLGILNTKMKAFVMKNYMLVGFTYIYQVLQKSQKTS